MDLDEYRARKAQEETEKNAQGASTETVTSQNSVPEPPAQEPQTNEPPVDDRKDSQVFEINGEQVTLEELQRGYMRQSDYTKKTQLIAQQSREAQEALALFEAVKGNPELAQQLNVDVKDLQIRQLEQQNYDFLVQQEINELSSKYGDFEVSEVLNFAVENNLNNLEHAYWLNKSQKEQSTTVPNSAPPVDLDAIKAQVKAELLAEMNTSTIINSQGGGTPPTQKTPELTPQELKIAKGMGMSPEEYAKWR